MASLVGVAGWVEAGTRAGGLAAHCLGLVGRVPGLLTAALLILVPVLLSCVLVWRFCTETRGRDLRELELGTVHAD